jgi:hypothetical protein
MAGENASRTSTHEIAPRRRRCQAPAALSVQRAFAVHFRPGGGPRRRRFRGRVEHLPSGRTAEFSSLQALLAFFTPRLDGDPAADAGMASTDRS